MQCAAGMAMHDPLLPRRWCARCAIAIDVHLIADEIAVGCGRTGTFFALSRQQARRVWPDFLCLSKGISGGYLPLSLVLSRDAIYEAFYDDDVARGFLHSHSYTGNPLACRAALATLDLFAQDDVLSRQSRLRARWRLTAALAAADAATAYRALPPARHDLGLRRRARSSAVDGFAASVSPRCAWRNELLIRPIGRTVYLMPPYVLDAALSAVARRTPARGARRRARRRATAGTTAAGGVPCCSNDSASRLPSAMRRR